MMGAKLKVISYTMNAVNIRIYIYNIQTCLKNTVKRYFEKNLPKRANQLHQARICSVNTVMPPTSWKHYRCWNLFQKQLFWPWQFLRNPIFFQLLSVFLPHCLGQWAFCSAPTHYLEKGVSRPMIRLKLCTTRCPETSRFATCWYPVRWDHKWSHLRHIQRM